MNTRIPQLLFTFVLLACAAFGQSYSQIADNTIAYIKAGTFGKPDVAKKTQKLAVSQVRVHYKTVTSRAVAEGKNSAAVTVYLDGGDLTTGDLQKLTDEFYLILQNKLGSLGITFADWNAIAGTEYYKNREAATEEKKQVNGKAEYGQAWLSFTAFDGPVFYRYEVERPANNELLGFQKLKKIENMCETLGSEFVSFDVVVDFASILLQTDQNNVRNTEGAWINYKADYSIGGMMSVPQSYIFFADQKTKFDIYQSKQPVAVPVGFSTGKPYENAGLAARKTKEFFGDARFTFTPVVIGTSRDRYLFAARRALEQYAELVVEKFRLIRGGEKPVDKNAVKTPVDTTTLKQVNDQARANNETTAVTTGEMKQAYDTAVKEKKYQLATDYLSKLIEAEPGKWEYYFERGAMQLNYLNQPKNSLKDFDQAIKLNSNEPLAYYNRGTAYVKLEDWKKAKKDFDLAIQGRPDYTDAYLNRGIASIYLKDLNAALADFNRGIQINPRVPNLYRARALVYKAQGNAAAASADELRAAQLER